MSKAKPEDVFRGNQCFISGPVTGVENRNKPAFDAVKKWLLYEGAEVAYNPTEDINPDISWEEAMRTCIRVLAEYPFSVLVCLPGSLESSGSTLEQSIAEALDMKIVYLDQSAVDKLKEKAGV